MGRHRIITTTVLTVALLCVPASALASSTLLSGYGGPGQGNQAIIGSTLVGGSGGGKGGGGSGGGSGSEPSGSSASLALPAQSSAPTPKKAAPSGRTRAPAHHRPTKVSGSKHASKTGAPAYKRTAATVQAGGGKTLGLTGADFFYIVLAACVLALTAVITGRVARRAGGTGGAQ